MYLEKPVCSALILFAFACNDGPELSAQECDAAYGNSVTAFEEVASAAEANTQRRTQEIAEGCAAVVETLGGSTVSVATPASVDEAKVACSDLAALLDGEVNSVELGPQAPCEPNQSEVAACNQRCGPGLGCVDACLSAALFAAVCLPPSVDVTSTNPAIEAALETHGKVFGKPDDNYVDGFAAFADAAVALNGDNQFGLCEAERERIVDVETRLAVDSERYTTLFELLASPF